MTVTTTSITPDRASILIDQYTLRDPEFIQVKITKLFSYPWVIILKKIIIERIAEINVKELVRISEALSPILCPKKPDIIAPTNGKNKIKYSIAIL
tara:strand:- start:408 stop:695 length:288 start_codon:yes stop_codon:yes gene_type:complete